MRERKRFPYYGMLSGSPGRYICRTREQGYRTVICLWTLIGKVIFVDGRNDLYMWNEMTTK